MHAHTYPDHTHYSGGGDLHGTHILSCTHTHTYPDHTHYSGGGDLHGTHILSCTHAHTYPDHTHYSGGGGQNAQDSTRSHPLLPVNSHTITRPHHTQYEVGNFSDYTERTLRVQHAHNPATTATVNKPHTSVGDRDCTHPAVDAGQHMPINAYPHTRLCTAVCSRERRAVTLDSHHWSN